MLNFVNKIGILKNFDVVSLGTATSDVFVQINKGGEVLKDPDSLDKKEFVAGQALCLPLGAKIEVGEPVTTSGGGAANAAVTFARAGLRTAAIISLGMDAPGRFVCAKLREEGAKVLPLWEEGAKTASSIILVAPGGDRTILHFRGASKDVSLDRIPRSAMSTKWLYVAPGHIPLKVMGRILIEFKKKGARIAINPSQYYVEQGMVKLKDIFRMADVVLLNREEAALLTNKNFEDEHGIFSVFDKFVDGLAVMTDGERGSLVSDGKVIFSANVVKVGVEIDQTGAGDAFGSGFVASLARSKKISEEVIVDAMFRAALNSASVVENLGAQAGIVHKNGYMNIAKKRGFKVEMQYLKK